MSWLEDVCGLQMLFHVLTVVATIRDVNDEVFLYFDAVPAGFVKLVCMKIP